MTKRHVQANGRTRTDEPPPHPTAKQRARANVAAFVQELEADGGAPPTRDTPGRRGRIESPERRAARIAHEAKQEHPSRPLNPDEYRYRQDYPADRSHVDWRDPDCFFETRLHKAALAGDEREVARLVEAEHANPFVRDVSGFTPCAAAHAEGHVRAGDYLHRAMQAVERAWARYLADKGRRNVRSRSKRYPRGAGSATRGAV